MEFIQFILKDLDKKEMKYTYLNNFGENPYVKGNCLFIPFEMLNEKYQKKFQENQKIEDNQIKNKYDKNYIRKNENINARKENIDFNGRNEYCSDENNPRKNNFEIDEGNIEKNVNYDLLNKLSKKEPTGLVNIGGVCYMNAVLQCFYYCPPLTNYFLKIDNEKKKSLGLIAKGYYELVNGLSKGNSYAARTFKNAMIEVDDTFYGSEGKDSKDVAILLLDELQNELKENEDSILYLEQNVNHFNLSDVYKEKKDLIKKNNNKTIITDTFNFFIKFEQTCKKNCKSFYKTYYEIESENIFVFELKNIYESIYQKRKNPLPEISLEECLQYYKKEKTIECPYCKTNTLKIKKVICSLPKIFIFVLSRGHNIEFNCKIKFKNRIDMKSYYEPINRSDTNTEYKLIGATFAIDWNYKGDGHTIAFCKTYKKNKYNDNEYYIFNDSNAYSCNINIINNRIPYLLFYEKCS